MRSILKQVAIWALVLGWISSSARPARAQCALSLCGLTLVLQSDAGGTMLGGSGTNAASLSFGAMQAYGGNVPTGVTRTVGSSTWTVATPFDVKITCTNLLTLLSCAVALTTSYTLTAQLLSSDSINTWRIGSSPLSSAIPLTVTSHGTYSFVTAYNLSLIVPFSEAAGTISNTVNFFAVAN